MKTLCENHSGWDPAQNFETPLDLDEKRIKCIY